MNVPLDKRAIDLTAADVLDIAKEAVRLVMKESGIDQPEAREDVKYGLNGIMEIFGCKRTKACKIHRSGILNKAIVPCGRSFSIDANMARQIARDNNGL